MASLQATKESCYSCGGELEHFSDSMLWTGIPGQVNLMRCAKCGEIIGSAGNKSSNL